MNVHGEKFVPIKSANRNVQVSSLAGYFLLLGCGLHIGWAFTSFINSRFDSFHTPTTFFVGCAVGAALAGALINRIGRRKNIFIATGALFIAGVFFLTPVTYLIYAGRIFAGCSFGIVYLTEIMYIEEISSTEYRGRNFIYLNMSLYLGCLLHYWTFSTNSGEVFIGLACVVCCILAAPLTYHMKESPYYLIKKGEEDNAMQNMAHFRETDIISYGLHTEFNETKQMLANESSQGRVRYVDDILQTNMKAFLFSILLKFIQAHTFNPTLMNGHLWVMMMMNTNVGLSNNKWRFMMFGAMRVFGAIAAKFNVDKYGRKLLLQISGFGGSLCFLIVPIIAFSNSELLLTSGVLYVSLILTFIVEFLMGLGFGTISDVVVGESLTTSVKPLALFIIMFLTSVVNITYYYIFQYAYWGLCLSCAIFLLGASLVVYFLLPETNGKSLAEAKKLFQSK